MKRCLALLVLFNVMMPVMATENVVVAAVKNTMRSTPAKERLKTFGSVAFTVGGLVYLLASYKENKKFDQVKELYASDALLDDASKRAQEAGMLEGTFNIWRSIRYFSTGSLIAGSFLLGVSMEDSFNLI